MYYSACASAVFSGMPLTEALPKIREAGVSVYEIWGWWDHDIDALAKAQEQSGLRICAMCTRMIPLNDPARHGEYLEGLRKSVEAARKLGCSTLISQVGQEIAGRSRTEQHTAIVEGLRACVPVLKEAGMMLVIEPLNVLVDHKGYYLAKSKEAFEIIREVGSEHVKVLYDVYHQQITEGNLIATIAENISAIGHVHVAGVPGRHEPDCNCEISYPAVFAALKAAGYAGAVGLEYFPTNDPVQSVRTLIENMPL